ncbi:hypothetical protein GCM10010532_091600 [Dactylosporangium siamense]|uniref:Uncharacterized protein n=1 Tax=Dactylosporangium siamense TaxID=685454 RepID=A0A919Q0I6_9ACTN|nr:hypothetical protein Dsi01nite_100190 [Dactylosporangium siamense]
MLPAGCGPLPAEPAKVSTLTWSPDGHVYFISEADNRVGEVWRTSQGGRAEAFLDGKALAGGCEGGPAVLTVVRAVGDAGLAVGFECPTSQDRLYLVDVRTRTMTPVLTGDDIRDVALEAGGARGYVAQQRGNCASVAGFSDGALHGLDVRVPALTGEWRLLQGYDESARARDGLTCGAEGKALSPVSTGDGRTVAMLVTIARRGAGLNGGMYGRYDWNVGVLEGDAIRLVGPTLRGAPHLALAPDGSRVALFLSSTRDGLQVFDLAGGDPRTVSTEDGASFPAFSPDGRTIAYSGGGRTSIKFAAVP